MRRIASRFVTIAAIAASTALGQQAAPASNHIFDNRDFAINSVAATTRRFIVESTAQTPTPAITRIPYFGGPLQTYLNLTPGIVADQAKLPFGANVTVPVAGGRAEIYGGAGGAFIPYRSVYTRQDTWFTQTRAGIRVALDPDRHVWLGGTAYYLTNFAEKKRQWGLGTADLTVRFGK